MSHSFIVPIFIPLSLKSAEFHATLQSKREELTAPRQLHDETRHFKDYILRTLQLKELRVPRQVANDLKTKNSSL